MMLLGCSTGRQSQSNYRRLEVQELQREDSVHVQRMIRMLKNRQAEIKHVEFSPPDSSGRQAIRSISRMTTKEEIATGDSLIMDAGVQTLSSDQECISLKEKSKWESNVLYPLAVVFIACALYLIVSFKGGK